MTPIEREPPLQVEGIAKRYKAREVLADVSFHVAAGERLCLLGANGSGKSTLVDIVSGVRRPEAGSVRIFGHEPTARPARVRRGVQLERPAFPHYAKIKDIVWLFCGFHGQPYARGRALEAFGLNFEGYVRHLSKGQRQTLAVGLALLGDPDLVILDEPTSGLDPAMRVRLWHHVNGHLGVRTGRALLYSTHDMLEAERADRVAVLHGGRIVASGSPASLRQAWVGTASKVTILPVEGRLPGLLHRLPADGVEAIAHIGSEIALYTDAAREVVARLHAADCQQIRIEPVSLEDVFFRITNPTVIGSLQHAV